MSEQGAAPPPGFYDDGSGQSRWWNGSDWAEQRLTPAKQENSKGIATVGYILAVLIPIVGFIYGLVLRLTGDDRGGTVVWLSVLVFLVEVLAGMLVGLAASG